MVVGHHIRKWWWDITSGGGGGGTSHPKVVVGHHIRKWWWDITSTSGGTSHRAVALRKDEEGVANAFFSRLVVKPFGVLGKQQILSGSVAYRQDTAPTVHEVLVDPAGLDYIQTKGPIGAGGASGALYEHFQIGDLTEFPVRVRDEVTAPGDAKFHCYKKIHPVIHAVGPDLRDGNLEWDDTCRVLGCTYLNVLRQFLDAITTSNNLKRTTLHTLRLPPISGGNSAGKYKPQIASLTMECLYRGFLMLRSSEQMRLLEEGLKFHLCIYVESQLEAFQTQLEAIMCRVSRETLSSSLPDETVFPLGFCNFSEVKKVLGTGVEASLEMFEGAETAREMMNAVLRDARGVLRAHWMFRYDDDSMPFPFDWEGNSALTDAERKKKLEGVDTKSIENGLRIWYDIGPAFTLRCGSKWVSEDMEERWDVDLRQRRKVASLQQSRAEAGRLSPSQSDADTRACASTVGSTTSTEPIQMPSAHPTAAALAETGHALGLGFKTCSNADAHKQRAPKEKTAKGKAAEEKATAKKAAAEKAAKEKAAAKKAAAEKAAKEKAAKEKAAAEKAATEKAAAEKAAAEQTAAERSATDTTAKEKAASEKTAAESAAAEQTAKKDVAAKTGAAKLEAEKARVAEQLKNVTANVAERKKAIAAANAKGGAAKVYKQRGASGTGPRLSSEHVRKLATFKGVPECMEVKYSSQGGPGGRGLFANVCHAHIEP